MPFHTERINGLRNEIQSTLDPSDARKATMLLELIDDNLTDLEASAQRCDLSNSISDMLEAFEFMGLVEQFGIRHKFETTPPREGRGLFAMADAFRSETRAHLTDVIKDRCFR